MAKYSRMKKNLVFILGLFVLSCAGLAGCSWTSGNEARIVTVTILPQKFFASQIAGDRYEINCIVPAGSNPEAYDPSPAHLVHLGKSQAYFRIGQIGFEMAWMDKLEQNNPDMKVFDTSKGIAMLTSVHSHEHAGTVHNAVAVDPHIWCSPKNAYIMARNMYEAFVELDPKGRDYYASNYEALLGRIAEVDSIVATTLNPVKGRAFAIYHPSLSYLARDYGLTQLCLENEGKESSAIYLKQAVEAARHCNVGVVFVQKEFNARQVETFASEIDARVVTINPLNYDWAAEMINIAYAIADE